MDVAVSWMDHPAFAATVLPLLEDGAIDAVEWSFDTAWSPSPATAAVLDAFANQGRLVGHGVSLSLLSARWTNRQEAWMQRLAGEVEGRTYRHISEHLGFSTAGDRTFGAPMPLPMSDEAVAIGVDRLKRLQDVAGVPVGLENLALALSPREVDEEGEFLDRLLEPVDGFVLLDLHNLWCRAVNFDRDPVDLLATYPLTRVREIHVSGGSWDAGFRRDTHDSGVPEEVFGLLERAVADCPNVDLAVVEQVPEALAAGDAQARFRADVRRVRDIVHA